MSNLNTKNCESECLLPVGHSSQKHSLGRSGPQSPLHRDLEMGDNSIQQVTEIIRMAVTFTTCGVIRKGDAKDHQHGSPLAEGRKGRD